VPQPAPQAPAPKAELVRRVILGLATGLIVVRALMPSEDVGLLEPGSNPMGLAVPLLWLCGLAAWAAWRIWSRQLDWYGGAVEAGLFGVVLCSFIATAAVASYQHPAWIVSWEWAGLWAAFFLVRQIARSASDQRGLLAALLATAVTLAGHSVVQRVLPDRGRAALPGLTAAELPRWRCEVLAVLGTAPQNAFPGNLSLPSLAAATSEHDPTLFERIAVRNNVRPESGEPALPLALRPTPPQPPAATFLSEANLAGLLALLLPALFGCVLAAWLGAAPRWQLGVAVGCAGLAALALVLSGIRSALLPCLLVGAAASVLAWRHYSSRPADSPGPSRRLLLLLALTGPATFLVVAFVLPPGSGQGFNDLSREWSAAGKMIHDHMWLGVGPGNYGRNYPQYMAADTPSVARQPDSLLLETWATLGLPGFLALVVALASFFRRTLTSGLWAGAAPAEEDDGRTRWEFYEGGMAGLLLGFLLRALPGSQETIVAEAVAAGVRALVWFAVFALIHGIAWGGATRVLACTAGVAALLLHLTVTRGISVPGVAQPLWVLAALALNGLSEQPITIGHGFLGRVLPLALATAAVLLYALQVVEPVTSAYFHTNSALATAQKYLDLRSHVSQTRSDGKVERVTDPAAAVGIIVKRLTEAWADDPRNARSCVDAANWCGELLDMFPANNTYYEGAVAYARTAQELDPLDEGGYLAETRVQLIGAQRLVNTQLRARAIAEAPQPLQKLIQRRPRDARLHYHLAVALFGMEQHNLARFHAEQALKFDVPSQPREYRLTEPQHRQAERFLSRPPLRRPLP
jgi:hypothetical protein